MEKRSKRLAGKRVAILVEDGFEQVELTDPQKAFSTPARRPTSSPRREAR